MNKSSFLFNLRIQKKLNIFLSFFILLGCFSINLPTAWLSVSIISITLLFFLLGNFRRKLTKIIKNSSAVSTVLFFLLSIVGLFYSSSTWETRFEFVNQYSKLLLIPILVCSVNSEKIRRYGINCFIVSSILVLLTSYGKWLHFLPINIGIHDIGNLEHGYAVFRNRISHNIFMSFAMYIFLIKAFKSEKLVRIGWIALAVITFFNIMYLVNGRSGQIVCLSLLLYLCIKKFKKSFIPFFLILCSMSFFLKDQVISYLPQRLGLISQEIYSTEKNHEMTSSGIRLVIYKSVYDLSLKSPIWGYGTGSLNMEYKKLNKEKYSLNIDTLDNPHNQYLLTFFETGVIGLASLLYMFFSHWMIFKSINLGREKYLQDIMHGLILVMLIGSLFNSMLLDAGEGRFYCIMAGLILSAYSSKKKKVKKFQ